MQAALDGIQDRYVAWNPALLGPDVALEQALRWMDHRGPIAIPRNHYRRFAQNLRDALAAMGFMVRPVTRTIVAVDALDACEPGTVVRAGGAAWLRVPDPPAWRGVVGDRSSGALLEAHGAAVVLFEVSR